jgi:hypothetical protein
MLKRNYWEDKQRSYLSVIKNALPELKKESETLKLVGEDEISRQLYLIIEAYLLSSEGEKLQMQLPSFQSQSQPIKTDKVKQKREDKRPDFLWSYVDYSNKTRRDFYIECKRLTKSKSVYCKNYVKEGINRFITKEWSYGLNCNLGLIVAYVQNLTPDECLDSIKINTDKCFIPELKKVSRTRKGLYHYNHSLKRTGIPHDPIELNHFWIEIG